MINSILEWSIRERAILMSMYHGAFLQQEDMSRHPSFYKYFIEMELNIELYDNGEIDGDTVSIYHNNELVVSHAGISTRPVTIKLKVDKEHPHHELVMVAENLGRIPPNTSLMIITAGKKRYEIFISSSEQKNAKILIDLQ